MFKSIVCATDGSEHAGRALTVAKSLASEQGAKLTLVHVVQRIASGRGKGLTWYANEEQVVAAVNKLAAELAEEGLNASAKILDDRGIQPAHDIADAAKEAGADLIVIGTRGHSAISGLLLGSVTQRLLHLAACPVLAVPPPSSGSPIAAIGKSTAARPGLP
jgi:nucleotide-binding universal stress UspA family protein